MEKPDLDQLLARIKDTRDRLQRLAVILDQNQKELDILEELERQLKSNLVELKRNNVVALAHEYKKAKEDLARTKNRVSFLRIDRETYLTAYATNDGILIGQRKQYAELLSRTQNNVIKGKFGKKDG